MNVLPSQQYQRPPISCHIPVRVPSHPMTVLPTYLPMYLPTYVPTYLLTYLTKSMKHNPREPNRSSAGQEIAAFYVTQMFITVFIKAHYLSPS
jgi:hypothetical protein